MPKMNKKTIIICLIFFFASALVSSEIKDINYEDLTKNYYRFYKDLDVTVRMPKLIVDDSHIYICDRTECHVYAFSRKDGKLTAEFGQKGEGPSELLFYSDVVLNNNVFYASNARKVVKFSKEGKFLGEISSGRYDGSYLPFGNGYVVNRFFPEGPGSEFVINRFSLQDSKLQDLKNLFDIKYIRPKAKIKEKQGLQFFYECRKAVVSGDELYVGCSDRGIYIAVFDLKGNKIREIKRDYDKIPVTQEIKDKILNRYNKAAKAMGTQEKLKRREILFPEFIPAFSNFFIDRDIIYLFKYPKPNTNGWTELLVMDKKGNSLKDMKIQLLHLYKVIQEGGLVTVFDGKMFFLYDQEESTHIYEMDLAEMVKQ